MRQLFGWFSMVLLSSGCSGTDLVSFAPTPSVPVAAPSQNRAAGWSPWYFSPWQPGLGAALAPGASVDAAVEADELCVPDIYDQWGARSCKRFAISVPSDGWLHAFLRWDTSAPGFDMSLAGEVVLVASNGNFATSGWKQAETQVFAMVQPGTYEVLVMSYLPHRLPFELRTELRSE